MKIYLLSVALIFAFIASVHVCRLVFDWSVIVNNTVISPAVDAAAVAVSLVLMILAVHFKMSLPRQERRGKMPDERESS